MENFTKTNSGIAGYSSYTRVIFLLIVMLANFGLYAQQDFLVRQVDTVRGDVLMVGNTILGLTDNPPNDPYNTMGTSNGGDGFNTSYIDIDGDNTTFSSSSADIIDPNVGCAEIVYAGLYWSANYYMARQDNISESSSYGLTLNNGSSAGFYDVRDSAFGNDVSNNNPVTGNLVLADNILACGALNNAGAIAGNIAVIRRGTCGFTTKVINAQNAGAIGVIVVNTAGGMFTMTGTAASTITIPSVMIGNNDINGGDLINLIQNSAQPISATLGNAAPSNVRITINNTTIAGVYTAGFSSFSSDNSNVRLSPASSNLVVAQPVNGCGITNGTALAGNIAIIREGGSCSNRQKIVNAQNAGAIGVIIVGNTAAIPTMTGGGSTINIPSVAIGNDDINGQDLITLVQAQSNVVNATISTTGNEQLTGLPATDPRINGVADYRDILLGFGPPGSVNYVSVQPQTGTQVVNGVTTHSGIIYDGYAGTASNPGTSGTDNVPYTCYADVTAIVRANGFGTYTVGNMKATLGETSGVSGAAGGWVLVVMYEDPTPSATNVVRFITTFDGFREIQGGADPSSADLTITGFRTLPAPFPVNVRFGAASLEGDNGITGDNLLIEDVNGVDQRLFNAVNPLDNFFNSSISVNGAYYPNRNPASQNTLGFDSDIFELPNAGRNLIGNDQTSANFTLQTVGDTYQAFLTAFSVENIVPKVRNIKEVYDPSDLTTVINNNPVNLGDALVYRLNLKNVGNEDLVGDVVINDILPANVNLISIDGIDVSVQPNGNLTSIPSIAYTTSGVGSGTQTITFTIPANLLERTDAEFHIDFLVELVATCEDLREACSNEISNVAVTTYTGEDSGITITDDPSSSQVLACGDTDGLATNFLATVPPCQLDTPFCGGDLRLVAGGGYDEYQWTGPGGFSATTNVNFVDIPNAVGGVYIVTKIDTDPSDGTCMTLQEQFNVTDFSATPHPLEDNAAVENNVEYFEACNVPLAKINLCGDLTYTIDTEFDPGNLVSITWQELTNTTCFDRDDDCPAVTGGCDANANWTDIATAPLTTSLTLGDAGEYRFIVEFQGGCTEVFYFDINNNDYQPAVDIVHMECNNDGSVTVNNIASPTLRFLLRLQSDPAPTLPGDIGLFTNASGVFNIPFQVNPYIFTVYAIDTAFPNCIFEVDGTVNSSNPTFNVTTNDPTCADNTLANGFGSVDITVTDGLPDYEYRITGGPNNIDITSGNGDASNGNFTFNNLEPGNYTVEVVSNNPAPNCVYSENITINPAPDFIAEVVLISPETCESGAIVQVNVTSGSGGPYEYADSSGVFTTNNQFVIPPPADPNTTYTFSVSDTSSSPLACIITADITGIEPYVPFNIDSVTPNNPVCPGDPGTIDVAVSSTSTVAGRIFTYELWDCSNDPNCNDAALRDTSLWILVQTVGPTINQNITFVGVAEGTSYAVSVSHNNPGDAAASPICRQNATIYAIQANTAVTANVAVTRGLSCIPGQEDAQVTISGFAGGSGTYEWSTAVGGPFTAVTLPNTVVDLAVDGNYTIFVRDPSAPDCPFTQDITIDPLETVDDITFTTPGSSNCSAQTYNVTATVLPAGPNYTIVVTPAPVSSGPAVNEFRLSRGIVYTFTATNTDNQCTYSEQFTQDDLPEIQITSAIESSPVICRGDSDGELTFTVTNSTTFDWEVRDSSNTIVNQNTATGTDPITVVVGSLPADTYTIIVRDTSLTPSSANCEDTTTVTITEPANPLTFTTTATDSNCSADTGRIEVTASGGRGNYQYRIVSSGGTVIVDYPNTNNVFTGLAVDTYTIFVRDGNDPTTACEVSDTETIDQFASPSIALDNGGDACYDGTNQASQWVTITPGINPPLGPFEYILDRGSGPETPVVVTFLGAPAPANTFEIGGLTPGNYTVFVRNTNTQCITNTINFTINPELTVTATLDKDIDCNGDAIISFSATGGTGAYTYEIFRVGTPDVSIVTNATSPYTSNLLTPGDYYIQAVDGQNCSADSNPVTVTAYDAIAANHTFTEPACPGDTGTITVNTTAGEGPFTYVLDGTTTIGPTGDTTVTFTGVTAGTHSVVITDGSGATPACTFTINNITLTDPDPIVATYSVTKLLDCSATPDAVVTVTNITGGSGTYEYSLDGTTYTAVGALPFTINFATDGSYTLYVRNQATDDCEQTFPITIDPELEVDTVTVTPGNISCTAQTTEVTLSALPVLTLPAVYEFEVSPDPATNVGGSSTGFSATTNYTFTNGVTYRVTARRSDSQCTTFTDFNQPVVDVVDITSAVQSQPVTCNGGADGALSFTVANTTTFDWEVLDATSASVGSGSETGTDPTTVNLGSLAAGTYTINVTDTNGAIATNCSDSTTVTITEPTVITFTPELDQTCNNNTVTVSGVSGGNGPAYTYTITHPINGTNIGPQPITTPFTGIANDLVDYTITVFDNTGTCSAAQTIAVRALPLVTLSVTAEEYCLDDGIASATVEITSGTPDYFYEITRDGTQVVGNTALGAGITTINATFTQAGTYVITVTDSVGCTETQTFIIEPAVELAVTQVSDITCDALGNPVDAEFSFVVTGGYTPYDIDVIFNGGAPVNHITNGVAPFANYTATLGAGTYEFVVTDDRGCSFTTSPFTVTDPVAPTITAPTVNVDCDGDLGTAIITVTGTETPYEIDFQNTGTFVTITGTQITFPNLAEAVYNFTVRSSRGCLYSGTVEIAAPDPIVEVSRTETPVTCGGSGTVTDLGAIDFEIAGGTANYTYTLVEASNLFVVPLVPATTAVSTPNPVTTGTTVRFEGLNFGQYYIFVEDANGCDPDPFGPFDIFSPPNDLVQNVMVSATCPGGVQFDIDVVGGSGINPPADPPPGFDIRIVGEPSPGLGDFVPLNDLVTGPTAVDANTPIRNHRYTGLDFNRTYILEVRDNATGCLYQELVPPEAPPSEPDILNLVATDVTCNETPALDDGTVSFDISGYDPSVTQVSWEVFDQVTNVTLGAAYSGTSAVVSPAIVPVIINNFSPGQYYVIVREDDGTLCPTRADFVIDIPDPLTSVATNLTPANSCGTNAQVIMDTEGGTPFGIPPTADGYNYAVVADGAGDPGVYPLTSNVIDLGIMAGDFDIWVADANGCSFGPVDVTVTVNPLPVIVSATFIDDCAYDNSNVIDIDATGLGTLLYQIDGGTAVVGSIDNNNHQFIVSTPGTYTITVTDESGCSVNQNVTVYGELVISAAFTTAPDCQTATGVITATVDSGVPQGTLTFELQDTLGGVVQAGVVGVSPFNFNAVAPGDYVVVVTDDGRGTAPFCSFSTTVGIDAPEQPVIDLPATNPSISCNSATDATIEVVLTAASVDPTATYTYAITAPIAVGPQTSPIFPNLGPGVYTILVTATQANGPGATDDVVCTATANYTVDDVTIPVATVTQADQFDCDGNTNATFEITGVSGGNGPDYTAEVTYPGGTPVISNIAVTLPTTTIEAPVSGTYNVQIFDSNGCPSAIIPVVIAPYTPMSDLTVTQTQAINCQTPPPAGDEIVEVSVQGGSGDFLFEVIAGPTGVTLPPAIDTPAGTNLAQFFNLPEIGTYTFRVTDQGDVNGLGLNCTITTTYDVPPFDLIDVNITASTDLTCFNVPTGELQFEVLNYTGAFEYDVFNVTTGTTVLTAVPVAAGFTNPITTASTLPAGEYEIRVTETEYPFCNEVSDRETITQPDELTLTLDDNINAFCTSDGRVIVSVTGGTPPYTYNDGVNPSVTTTSTTHEFSLPGGPAPGINYTITVTDANTCTSNPANLSVDVILTPDPTLNPLTVDDVCTHDGSYVITATGTSNVAAPPGTGALRFQLNTGTIEDANNGLTSHQFTVSTPGTYQVTAYDENGCQTNTESITILPEIIASADFTGDPTCRDADGTITVTISGGSDFAANPGNFTFTLRDQVTNAVVLGPQTGAGSNIFNSVPAGDYIVEITDINIPAITAPCTITIDVPALPVPADPTVVATATPVSCIGATDGTVTATVTNLTTDDAPYLYQLFVDTGGGVPGAQVGTDQIDNPIFTGIAISAGNYVVVVTSDRSCTGQALVTVPNATQVTASATQSNYGCAADNSEIFPVITVTIQDGTAPYTVSYDTPSGNTITAIDVTDADGGLPGVQYEILADEEGNYVITVTDFNGCNTLPITITESVGPFPIMTNPTVTPTVDITCLVDEVVDVSVQGGSGDFLFEVIDGPTGATLPAAQDEPAGTSVSTFTLPRDLGIYTFRITDQGTNCTITVTHEIEEFDFIAVTATQQTPESCYGDADGTIAISITGYTGTYNFEVLDENGNSLVPPITGTGDTTTDPDPYILPVTLPQGTYRIQVVETADPSCTELSNVVTVDGPDQPLMAFVSGINTIESCNPGNDGSFQASVTGAQGATVTYELFLTSDTTFTTVLATNQTGLFENLSAEDYTVRATDGNGCTNTAQIVIAAPNPITLNPLTKTDVTCFGAADGTITASATGGQGAGTYLYVLTRPDGSTDAGTSNPVFQNIGPGVYSVIATDNLNCDTPPQTIEILEPNELTVNFTIDRNVTCPDPTMDVTVSGTSDGTIVEYVIVNVTDPINPVETSNGNNPVFLNIPEGEYQFYVRDDNGCQSPLSGGLTVIPIPEITFELDLTAAFINCTDGNNAVVDVQDVTGGTGDYTFTLTGTLDTGGDYGGSPAGISQATSEFRDLPAGSYTYTITTARACSASRTFTVTNPPLFVPEFIPTSVTCFGEDDGTITINASGGTPPYSFAIGQGGQFGEFLNDESDGVPNQHIFENLEGGVTYTVLAQDSLGCQEIMDFTIDEPTQLVVDIVGDVTPEECAGDMNGAVTISVTGGTPPYFTNITNNDADFVQDMFTYNNLPGGQTIIYIRDSNNCRTEYVVDIPPGVVLGADMSQRLDCPVWDYSNPEAPFISQGPRYFINFELNPGSVTTEITYMLTGINGTPDPTPAVNTTGEFEVSPGQYEGSMMHVDGCVQVLGSITVEEYTPMVTPVAQMTNNPQDPNEYEIIVTGGSGNPDNYTYFIAILPDELSGAQLANAIAQLTDADFRELDSNIFSIDETANYVIRVIDERGCEVLGVQNLTFINIRIPNYFTPDGDGTDDFWYPDQISPNDNDPFFFQNMEVKVFDRYGRLLERFVGDQKGWDGIYQGKELPSGDYWYTIILNDVDNRTFTGHFTLYR